MQRDKRVIRGTTRLDIGTLSFARCSGRMLLPPRERLRLILAAAHALQPDLLVTAGALTSAASLRRLSRQHGRQRSATTIVTEATVASSPLPGQATCPSLWIIHAGGTLRHLGDQLSADLSELRVSSDGVRTRFELQRAQRTFQVDGLNVFALSGAEIELVQGRAKPRFAFTEAEQAILAADIVAHLAPERLATAGAVHAQRELLSRYSPAGRDRVYVGCADWDVFDAEGRMQWPQPDVQVIYRSGERLACDELADGAFGFVYQRWAVKLLA